MTEKGELMTLEGEFAHGWENVFLYNKRAGVNYSVDIDNPDVVEIRMHHPENQGMETYQMIFILKGTAKLKTEQDKTELTLSTNQHNLFRVMPGSYIVINKNTDEVIWINLNRNFVNKYLSNHYSVPVQTTGKSKNKAITKLFPRNMSITSGISAVLQQLKFKPSGGFCDQLIMESKTIELLALQIAQNEQFDKNSSLHHLEDDKRERMQSAKEIIINHTGKQLSLKMLAHMVGTNEFDLKKDFKIVFGNTVYGYLKNYKMEIAKTMLIKKEMTVAEIALKLGYKHATHFTSAFKKYFGYLPNTLRTGKLLLIMLLQEAISI